MENNNISRKDRLKSKRQAPANYLIVCEGKKTEPNYFNGLNAPIGIDIRTPALLKGKRVALITTCGYPIEKGADVFEDTMKRYCRHCGPTFAGMLAERQRNLKEAFMDEEKEMRARVFAKSLL